MDGKRNVGVTPLQFGALGLGLPAIFFVPYLFQPTGIISDAYMVGFSTRVALLLVLLVTLGFAWWTRGAGLSFATSEAATSTLSRKTLYWTGAITTIGAALVWVGMHYAGPLNEGNYFADRLLMQQSGAKVYLDFEFP